jgi:hypothetical protein
MVGLVDASRTYVPVTVKVETYDRTGVARPPWLRRRGRLGPAVGDPSPGRQRGRPARVVRQYTDIGVIPPGHTRDVAAGCRAAGDHRIRIPANRGTVSRTCVLMEKASQRVRQYVLIRSMSQETLPVGVQSDGARVDTATALGTTCAALAAPVAGRIDRPGQPGSGRGAHPAVRVRPDEPRARLADGPRAAAGSPRSWRSLRDHGRRPTARWNPTPAVAARAPC